jgi:hypothetical protein
LNDRFQFTTQVFSNHSVPDRFRIVAAEQAVDELK